MSDLKPVRVKAEIFFARDAYTINKRFDEDNNKYQMTLGNLSEAACDALQGMGIKIKNKEIPGKHITGKSLYAFKFYTEDGDELPAERIGNGTEVVALVTAYNHKLSKMHGAAPSIKKVIVTKLKEYNPERATEEEDVVL